MRRAIGPGADELDLQPVAAVAGVLEQDVVGLVAGISAAQDDEQVEVAVAVPVGERDAVPFLKVAGPGGVGHVLEAASLDVLEHHVGNQARVGHPAGPEVGVEVAVVVDVAEVGAHRRDRPVEADFRADVAEALLAEVPVEVRVAGVFALQAEVVGDRRRPRRRCSR